MGWKSGDLYERVPVPQDADERSYRAALREQMRCHKLAMDGEPNRAEILRHYEALSRDEKDKDWMPFNSMLKLVKKFDGLRIYRFSGHAGHGENAD